MKIELEPGKYIVAVSGGVDSISLLDILSHQTGLELIVTHYDHGIRKDSGLDRQLVQQAAKKYSLQFVYEAGKLVPHASEATARKARYDFLQRVCAQHNARAIITAHHQDDVLETAILNILRGTGRRGLSSLRSRDNIIRPLLDVPKQVLVQYAKEHKLSWREDETNLDTKYLRNYIRHNIVSKLASDAKGKLIDLLNSTKELNEKIENNLANELKTNLVSPKIDRYWFIMLPHSIAREILAAWLRKHGIYDFDRGTIERLVVAAKTLPVGKQADVNRGWSLSVHKSFLALKGRDR